VVSSEKFIPTYEQFYLGGTNTLRGYAEEQFLGSRIAWTNLELRRLFARNSRVAIFYDLGYYREKRLNPFRPDSSEIVKGTRSGYGIGLRAGNETALLKLDYALGQGDHFEQGKIHVGLESRF
jgi:outer membrane protein insertion porin family